MDYPNEIVLTTFGCTKGESTWGKRGLLSIIEVYAGVM